MDDNLYLETTRPRVTYRIQRKDGFWSEEYWWFPANSDFQFGHWALVKKTLCCEGCSIRITEAPINIWPHSEKLCSACEKKKKELCPNG